MKQGFFTVAENRPLTDAVYRMALTGSTDAVTTPGQFIDIRLDGFYLRRPISVFDWDDHSITIVYKTVGKGTDAMAGLLPGARLDILTGLGNGYNTAPSGPNPLLIGGGVGAPPLYALCKQLLAEGKTPSVLLGANTASEVILKDDFETLLNGSDGKVLLATADGSAGEKGFVTGLMDRISYTYFYACGPRPMFEAIEKTAVTGGQYSFEERMGCGFGACMGCSVETKNGPKRICRDGPVLYREEVIW